MENELNEQNSIIMLAAAERADIFDSVIHFIDESGTVFGCTADKFVEIFDKEGLSGFVM